MRASHSPSAEDILERLSPQERHALCRHFGAEDQAELLVETVAEERDTLPDPIEIAAAGPAAA